MGVLTEEDIRELRYSLCYDSEMNQVKAAEEWDVCQSYVSRVARGKTRTDVGGPIRGQDYGIEESKPRQTKRKLTPKQVEEIRVRYREDPKVNTTVALANQYGVSSGAVSLLTRGITYKDCPGPIRGCESGEQPNRNTGRPVGSQLTSEEVVSIRKTYKTTPKSVGYGTLGKLFERSPNTIRRVVCGDSHQDKPGPIKGQDY
jgi:hypothetical protein